MNAEYQVFEVDSKEAIVSGNDEEDPLPRKTTLQKILGVCCQNTCLSRISSQWLDDRYEGLDDDSMHSLDKDKEASAFLQQPRSAAGEGELHARHGEPGFGFPVKRPSFDGLLGNEFQEETEEINFASDELVSTHAEIEEATRPLEFDLPGENGFEAQQEAGFDAGGAKIANPTTDGGHEEDTYGDEAVGVDEDDGNGEPSEEYRDGGYHPVSIGEIFNNRFKVLNKLGWGVYSTVWMAEDITDLSESSNTTNLNRRVALKVQKSSEDYYFAAQNEIRILNAIKDEADASGKSPYIVRLHDFFDVVGPNGRHPCMVFEPLGENLLAVLERYERLPVVAVRQTMAQLLSALEFLHNLDIVHTDIKPENVLVVRRSHSLSELQGFGLPGGHSNINRDPNDSMISLGADDHIIGVKLVDVGNAFFVDEQDVEDIQTREYRCIESMLGIRPFQPVADVWSLGCLCFELLTGQFLFNPNADEPEYDDEDRFSPHIFEPELTESHLEQCVELLGPVPVQVLDQGLHSGEWFDGNGALLSVPDMQYDEQFLGNVLAENFQIQPEVAGLIADFVKTLCVYDPLQRPVASDCLEHAFFTSPAIL